MEERHNQNNRPVNPRRKKRSKMAIFKEAYLPALIAALVLILIIVFIASSISKAAERNKLEKEASIAASIAQGEEEARLAQQAESLIAQAEVLAKSYDYKSAIDLLYTFEGKIAKYPAINDKILEYEAAQKEMVAWEDPSQVLNLSFQMLVADPARGFADATWGTSINRNFVTTAEFSKILQQLYDNGYVLVDFDDFISVEEGASGKLYKTKTLHLPKGKKPLMLTQTNVNYHYYLIDSDGDRYPDANGCGFASKLLWDGNNFTCEMVDASGNTVTGDYDLIPILEKFVASHPDFSYQGAKAVIALTGYNGILGYRTHPNALNIFGETEYQKAIQEATKVVNALRDNGYTLACYTYDNTAYGDSTVSEIKHDLMAWDNEVVPILGNVDILVYAQLSDIAAKGEYAGDKFTALHFAGFRYYLGFNENGSSWATVTDSYVRQGRLMVTGSNIAYHADWFSGLFDPASVLDASRGTIPQ